MADMNQELPPVHLRDHLRVIAERKWTAVLFFLAVVGMTGLYLLFSKPYYSAKVVMILNPPAFSPLTMMSELIYSAGLDVVSKRLYTTTQFDVLKSRKLAEKVLDRLDLWSEYGLGEEMRSRFGLKRTPVSREAVARDLAGRISAASPNIMSNAVELTVRSETPERAARIANAIVEVYLETLYEERERKIEENLTWLRREFKVLEEELLNSDQAVQEFKKRHNTISVDDRENILTQKLHGMNASLVQARIARIAAENAHQDAQGLARDPKLLGRAGVILASNPQIAALQGQLNLARTELSRIQERYGEKHPRRVELAATTQELEGRIRQEVLEAIDTLRITCEMARSQEEALVEELEAAKQEVLRLGEERIRYLQLKDQSTVNRTVFETLLNRLQETKLLLTFQNPLETLQVIDRAMPPARPAGFRPYFLPVAAAVGLLLGIFLCYVRDYFDDTFRSEREVQDLLKLPLLGRLPRSRYGNAAGRRPAWDSAGADSRTTAGQAGGFATASRSTSKQAGDLATNGGETAGQAAGLGKTERPAGKQTAGLRAASGPEAPLPQQTDPHFTACAERLATMVRHLTDREDLRVVLIASACPGEGKTTVVAALGAALARRGKRVLLADGNLSKPDLHRLFSLGNDRGFADLLQDDSGLHQAALATGLPGLFCLPAGHRPPQLSASLDSEPAGRVLRAFLEDFDILLVDSGAVLTAGDTADLARWSDAVLWVVSYAETPRDQALAARNHLTLLDRRILGAVLNKAP